MTNDGSKLVSEPGAQFTVEAVAAGEVLPGGHDLNMPHDMRFYPSPAGCPPNCPVRLRLAHTEDEDAG
jgi:hypothetical protein